MKHSKLAGLILMILSLYPLSFGPVVRIVWDPRNHFTEGSKKRAIDIYGHLIHVRMLSHLLDWYCDLCTRDLEFRVQMEALSAVVAEQIKIECR